MNAFRRSQFGKFIAIICFIALLTSLSCAIGFSRLCNMAFNCMNKHGHDSSHHMITMVLELFAVAALFSIAMPSLRYLATLAWKKDTTNSVFFEPSAHPPQFA